MHCGKFQEGASPNPKGGSPILNIGKANCQGGGENTPGGGGGDSTPSPPPPEINPGHSYSSGAWTLISGYTLYPVPSSLQLCMCMTCN